MERRNEVRKIVWIREDVFITSTPVFQHVSVLSSMVFKKGIYIVQRYIVQGGLSQRRKKKEKKNSQAGSAVGCK
jgi:hypothetical protein